MGFVPLHIHSEYSLLESSCRIDALVRQAAESGFSALALTDKGNMYGALKFYTACKKAGIKPILGLEAEIGELDSETHAQTRQSGKILLYAQNKNGYQNLLKLSTLLQTKQDGEVTPISHKELAAHSQGLIALSSGMEGEVQQHLSSEKDKADLTEKCIRFYQETFPERFYLGLEDHGTGYEKTLNLQLQSLAREYNLPLLCSHETYYLHAEDAQAHDVLVCIKNGEKINNPERYKLPTGDYYFKSPHEIKKLFSHSIELIEETQRLADMCNVGLTLGEIALPKYPVPGGRDSFEYLTELCLKGAENRFDPVTSEIKKRLHYELTIIKNMNFEDYFLIVWDFMKYAHDVKMITGPGRGSAAGSLVAYVLEITNVDPMQHNLIFERFLNPERITMPDIDIDFPDNRRDEVLRYVAEKYGTDYVAQIITFGTLAARAAVRDAGRVMDLPPGIIDQTAKNIPSRPGISLKDALKESHGLQQIYQSDDSVKKLIEVAMKLEGLPRHASTHAAGVVLSRNPLVQTVPLQTGHDGIPLTQYSMEWLEAAGLLKMDFLGLRNLSLIENIILSIEKYERVKIDLNEIPFNDRKTFDLLSQGDTTGVFQLESDGMRKVLQQLKPTEFEDIVAVNALYRPGPMQNIPEYIAGKNGLKTVEYMHPDLESILKNTYGVIVYQEQIMQIATKAAGFTLGEADLLRRAVGKKKREILIKEREHFVAGCLKQGYDEKSADALYDLIVRFADYGFPRSHAVAYSVIAYQLAYLKANYPIQFMSALLSSVIGNHDKVNQYIKESRQKGVRILPPSIKKSTATFIPEGEGIRFGLLAIKNVGINAIQTLMQENKKEPFRDLFDLCARCPQKIVNKRTLESLIFAGAMDDLGEDRAVLLASLETAIEYGEEFQEISRKNQMYLFDDDINLPKPSYVQVQPFQDSEKLKFEKESLGFFFSSHPLERYRKVLNSWEATDIAGIKEKNSSVRLGVLIDKVRVIKTKKGELMAFLSLSDESGEIEAVVFPKVYESYHGLLQKGEQLFLEGSVEQRNDALQVLINKCKQLHELKFKEKAAVFIKIDKQHHSPEYLNAIKHILDQSNGSIPVVLIYEETKQKVQISQKVHATEDMLMELQSVAGEGNVVFKRN
ncbi:DNA polymerase III subunit alpha [Fictibacillus phosphorivorans]|uniref:DNA polymerase III subunit alpha n=1 Tax=Fictibacillus phosphorivorans TaxID=1221500 RepID=UPI00203A3A4C|nr:DNA polymerase III subunit alpha [Fictibacillus phosphorivorans]MCM3717924.1 DNA polymerase III subunit alpha [Fictibacillus phosphorivorans]MCM3775373.1 DNA polymerase III subunit alpha [Fictibacillus phosphorivorans]